MMADRAVHPVTDLFPMLGEEDLDGLAADIAERGLLQPIILDAEGRIIDGRNRHLACQMAGVEPWFETYDGEDPAGYALSVNIARRSLSKGQAAMVVAEARFVSKQDMRSAAKHSGVSASRIAYGVVVHDHAPELVADVISGARGLDEAYRVARERKTAADSAEAQLARLRGEDPELAERVDAGELTLAGAWAEHRERAAEAQRQRRVATHLLCEHLVTIAQMAGGTTAERYDPEEALPGRAVTRQIIADAMTAIEEIAQVWKERELL